MRCLPKNRSPELQYNSYPDGHVTIEMDDRKQLQLPSGRVHPVWWRQKTYIAHNARGTVYAVLSSEYEADTFREFVRRDRAGVVDISSRAALSVVK